MKALLAAFLLTSTTSFAQIKTQVQVRCHIYTIDDSANDSSVTHTLALPVGTLTGNLAVGEVEEQKITVQISADREGQSYVSAVCADQSQFSTFLICAKDTLELQTIHFDRVTTTITCSTLN